MEEHFFDAYRSSGSAGASSSFDSASASSSASSSDDYTLVCQCGYVTSVPHPLTRYFNFLGKTLIYIYIHICALKLSQLSILLKKKFFGDCMNTCLWLCP